MSKFWRMQWHAEAKWSGYNGAEMLNGGWGRLRVMGWRRSNKHKPCILLFAPTMISTDGFIYLSVVCVSLSSHCVLSGLTLMRLSRGSLLCVCSNHWSVQTEFIVSPVVAMGPDYVLYWPTLRLTYFFFNIFYLFSSHLPWKGTLFLTTHLQPPSNFYFTSRSDELMWVLFIRHWLGHLEFVPISQRATRANIPQHSIVPHTVCAIIKENELLC